MFRTVAFACLSLFSSTLAANQFIEIDGKKLEYEISGNGHLHVLFDAGALTGMAGWDSLWNDIPDGITAIRFSRLGEGNSDMCSGSRTSRDHVEEVQQVLTALDVDMPFVYVGHSLGGATARNYASTYSENVLGMLLVDPENPRDVEIVKEIDPVNGPTELEKIKQNDYKLSNGHCFLDAIWSKEKAKDYNDIGDIPVTLISTTMRIENPKSIFNSDIGRKRWGEIQNDWVSTFPQGRYVTTTESGHYIQKTEPGLVLKELSLLLKRVNHPVNKTSIAGKWQHNEKPVVIEFNMEKNEAIVFEQENSDSAGLNLIRNIEEKTNNQTQWTGSMYDGYNNRYVNVSLEIIDKDLMLVTTNDGKEVLRLVR